MHLFEVKHTPHWAQVCMGNIEIMSLWKFCFQKCIGHSVSQMITIVDRTPWRFMALCWRAMRRLWGRWRFTTRFCKSLLSVPGTTTLTGLWHTRTHTWHGDSVALPQVMICVRGKPAQLKGRSLSLKHRAANNGTAMVQWVHESHIIRAINYGHRNTS